MKKIIVFLCAVLMVCLLLPVGIRAGESDESDFYVKDGMLVKYRGNSTEVVIPESVTSIGNAAFMDCSSIKSIIIPESVTDIGYSAFSGCSSLTNVTISKSVTVVGIEAFSGCSSLKSIEVDSDNLNYCSVDGILYDKSQKELKACPAGISGNVIIPDGVTCIGLYAFSKCSDVTSIIIPESVTDIQINAFYNCTGLKSIAIPKGVESLGGGKYAFSGCSNLTSIYVSPDNLKFSSSDGALYDKDKTRLIMCLESRTGDFIIPEGVTSISNNAFVDCKNITSIYIPDSVTSMVDSEVITGCDSLKSIDVSENNSIFSSTDGVLYSKDKTHLILCPRGITGEVIIQEGTLAIDGYAFENCRGITNVTIPEGVINIGWAAFQGCDSLTSINIPGSVIDIEIYAFVCSNLTNISVSSDNQLFSSVDGILYNKDKTKLVMCPGKIAGEFIIPKGVTSIGDSAFVNCNGITRLTIPDSVTSIGDDVFFGCSNVIIRSTPDSYAKLYADMAGIPWVCEHEWNDVGNECVLCGYGKLSRANDGNWYYYKDGEIDTTKTGIVENKAGCWYVENGKINFNKSGVIESDGKEYVVKYGYMSTGFYGLVKKPDGIWAYAEAGVLTYNYTGLAKNDVGWWYIKNGVIDFSYIGIGSNQTGDYRVVNGLIDFTFNGWFRDNNTAKWYYMKGGMVDMNKAGLVKKDNDYYYVSDGGINFNYTGLAENAGNTYYIKYGYLDFTFSGVVTVGNKNYTVEKGIVKK